MAEVAQIDYTINGAPAANTLSELETKAEQLRAALGNAQFGSDEFKRINQELVQTNKQVKNLELGFEALDKEQVASELGSVAGAIGDITSAFILLGGESESMQKVAANIQQAIGVSMAFKGAIEGVSSAMKLFNNIVKANPLFLLVAAIAAIGTGIALLIKYWDEFVDVLVAGRDFVVGVLNSVIEFFTGTSNAIETASMRERKAHEQRMKQQQEIADAHKERLKQIEKEKTETISAIDDTIEALELEKDTLEAQGKVSDEVTLKILEAEKEKTIAVLNANKAKIESWAQYYRDQAVLNGQSEEEFKKSMLLRGIDLELFQQKAEKLIQDNENAVQYSENKITSFKREQSEERLAIAEAEAERLKQLEEERLERERQERLFKLEMLEREQEADRLFNERLEAEREQRFLDETLRLEAQIDAENKLKDEQEQKELERVERNKQAAQSLFDASEGLAQLLHDRELKRANEKVARGENLTRKEIQRLKRQDAINKAFALAEIARDTAQGVMGAIKAGAGIPFPGNLFAIASGVAAVISGATQAAQILGQAVEIPSVNTATNVDANNIQNNTETPVVNPVQSGSTFLNNEMSKVYVVESEITDKQNKVKGIIAEATYG